MKWTWENWYICGACLINMAVGQFLGHRQATNRHREESIKAGVARWVADPVTGAAKFEYIAPK